MGCKTSVIKASNASHHSISSGRAEDKDEGRGPSHASHGHSGGGEDSGHTQGRKGSRPTTDGEASGENRKSDAPALSSSSSLFSHITPSDGHATQRTNNDPHKAALPTGARHGADGAHPHEGGSDGSDDRTDRPYSEENHFDPIEAPFELNADGSVRQPSERCGDEGEGEETAGGEGEPVPVVFHTTIDPHDKTDATQAAEEYQSRILAKKSAEDAKTARLQVELFDPIRPVDSFNVTHRALLGRCWDRRVPEVPPISFVHTALALEAAALREPEDADEALVPPTSAEASGGVVTVAPQESAHPHRHAALQDQGQLYETFSAAPPAHGVSLLRRQQALERSTDGDREPYLTTSANVNTPPRRRNSTMSAGPYGSVMGTSTDLNAAIGAGGVPRRSHWFSVVGISTQFRSAPAAATPTGALPLLPGVGSSGTDSGASGGSPDFISSPNLTRTALLAFPQSTATAAAHSAAAYREMTKQFSSIPNVDDIRKLPMADRVELANKIMACNVRYYGIKSTYAFRVSEEEVPPEEDEGDAGRQFLRRAGLNPARGVRVLRWNRVEFFNPNFLTLTKAVAKTEGIAHLSAATMPEADGDKRGGHRRSKSGGGVDDGDLAFGPSSPRMSGKTLAPSTPPDSPVQRSGRRGLFISRQKSAHSLTRGASSLSLDSQDGAGLVQLMDPSASTSRQLSNLSFIGQHVIAKDENVSFATTPSNGRVGGSRNTGVAHHRAGSTDAGRGGHGNTSFLHRSLLGHAPAHAPHKQAPITTAVPQGDWTAAAHSGALTGKAPRFPEDSVLCLAMEVPPVRLPKLAGVPPQARAAASFLLGRSPTSNTSSNARPFPSMEELAIRPRTATSPSSVSVGSPVSGQPRSTSPPQPSGASARATSRDVGTDSFIIALTISSFSVSIDPFRWEENRYVRHPVDVDGYKSSSRRDYGEGAITDIMYGGVLVIECSSADAVKHLLTLLRDMKWNENRSPAAIVGDVKKRVKQYREALSTRKKVTAHGAGKRRHPLSGIGASSVTLSGQDDESASMGGKGRSVHTHAASGTGAHDETAAPNIESFQYRISRRIGGRPMRDAVELKQISVFLGDAIVEQSQTLSKPPPDKEKHAEAHHHDNRHPRDDQSSSSNSSSIQASSSSLPGAVGASAANPLGLDPQQQQQMDPDTTPSFSRVASAWVGLPAISAVMRTWGMHLLCNPQYAQPISFFLQRFSGIAPVVQHTALSSLFHMGGTPTDQSGPEHDRDDEGIQFFESDMGFGYGAPMDGDPNPCMPPTKRISKFNPFYASLPGSENSSPSEAAHPMVKSASRETLALEEQRDDSEHAPHGAQRRAGSETNTTTGSSRTPPPMPRNPWSGETLAHEDSFMQGPPSRLSYTAIPETRRTSHANPNEAASLGTEAARKPIRQETAEDAFANEVIDDDEDVGGGESELDEMSPLLRRGRNPTFVFADSPDASTVSPGHSLTTQPAASQSAALDSSSTNVVREESASVVAAPPGPLMRTQKPSSVTRGAEEGSERSPTITAASMKTAPPSPNFANDDSATLPPHSPHGPPPRPPAWLAPTNTSTALTPAVAEEGITVKEGTKASGRQQKSTATAPKKKTGRKPRKKTRTGDKRSGGSNSSAATTTTTGPSTPSPLSASTRPASMSLGQEMENLWNIAALEVKAQQQELAEMQEARRKAEEQQSELLEEMRALHKAFLPNTTVQELDLAFLYLKTALFEPEDLPQSRVFYNNADWLPMLTALWTSPANSIRSVEVSYPLLSHDLPKVGVLSGLLYHRFAAAPLEHLEMNATQMLGCANDAFGAVAGGSATSNSSVTARQGSSAILGGEGKGEAAGKTKKKRTPLLSRLSNRKGARKKGDDGKEEEEEDSEYEPLVFNSPNAIHSGPSMVLGPGTYSPPFYVNPEQARDTLWLLLCAIADNTTCVEFRLCLRGFPTMLSTKDQEKVKRKEAEENQRTASSLEPGGAALASGEKLKSNVSIADFFARRKQRQTSTEQFPILTHSFELCEDTLNLGSFVVSTSLATGPGGTANTTPDSSLSPVQTYTTFSQGHSRGPSLLYDSVAAAKGMEAEADATPKRHDDRPLPLSTAASSIVLSRDDTLVLPPVGSGAPYKHMHKATQASWMHAEAHALVLPFYTILFHPCTELPHTPLRQQQQEQQERIAAACRERGLAGALLALADAGYVSNPYTAHYHNEYTHVHNNDDFYIPPQRQRTLAELAVKALLARQAVLDAAASADSGGENADGAMALPSWRTGAVPMTPLTLPGTPNDAQQHPHPCERVKGDDTAAAARPVADVGLDGLCASWGMSELCLGNRNVFGLMSAAEEAAVYAEESARLLRHSDEIWSVLRKATHHFNKASAAVVPGASVGDSTNATAPHSPKGKAKDRKGSIFGGSRQHDSETPSGPDGEPSKWRRAIILER